MNDVYMLRSKSNGKYIALDNASGGYPCEVNWYKAYIWLDLDSVAHYKETVDKKDEYEILLVTEPVVRKRYVRDIKLTPTVTYEER